MFGRGWIPGSGEGMERGAGGTRSLFEEEPGRLGRGGWRPGRKVGYVQVTIREVLQEVMSRFHLERIEISGR